MIGKNNDQNLPPINLSNTDKPATNKKSTRKTESILARMPKVRTTTGQSKLGLFDRLRNLSKKDFAYLAAASGVVITLPFAEHYMVKPEATPRVSAFSTNPSRGNSSGAGEVFEPGNGAFAPGGAPGGSSDVVTPLSARDPSSLIIGPGDGQQAQVLPMQQTPPPSTPAPVKDSPITSAVRAGASSANNTAAGPFIPSSKLQAHIRGLESVSGGGKASAGELWGGKVLQTAKSVPNTAAMSNSVAPTIMRGYAGVARSRTSAGSNSAMEDLKRGASNAADYLNGRNAVQSLDRAADASVYAGGTSAGGGPGGGPGEGQGYKGAGVNNISGAAQRSAGKESLEAELARTKAMAELQRQIKWKDYLKLELPKMIIDTMAKAIMEPIGKAIGSKVSDALAGPSTPMCVACIDRTTKEVRGNYPDSEKFKDAITKMQETLGGSCNCSRMACSKVGASNTDANPKPTNAAATKTNTKYDDKLASAAVYHDVTAGNVYKSATAAIKDCEAKGTACTADVLKTSVEGKIGTLKEQYASALEKYKQASKELSSDASQLTADASGVTFDSAYADPATRSEATDALEIIGKCYPSVAEGYQPLCTALNESPMPLRAKTSDGLKAWMADVKIAYDSGAALQQKIASLPNRSGAGLGVVDESLAGAESLLNSVSAAQCDTTANCSGVMAKLGEPVSAPGATAKATTALDLRAAVGADDSVSSLLQKARGTIAMFNTEKSALEKVTAYDGSVDAAYSEYAAIALVSVAGATDLAELKGKKKDFEELVNGNGMNAGLDAVFKAYVKIKNLKPPVATPAAK